MLDVGVECEPERTAQAPTKGRFYTFAVDIFDGVLVFLSYAQTNIFCCARALDPNAKADIFDGVLVFFQDLHDIVFGLVLAFFQDLRDIVFE